MNGKVVQTGKVFLEGNRGNLYVSTTKPEAKTVAAIYSFNPGITVDHYTLVMGSSKTDVPTGWDTPWIEGGSKGHEFVFVKDRATEDDE